jgi:hypothetical protein
MNYCAFAFLTPALALLPGGIAFAQSVIADLDPTEKAGQRPYEMVWANRVESAPPTVRFDDLRGWTMRVEGGAQASLQLSRAQNVWDRPVARLRYQGDGQKSSAPRIRLIPPIPIALPAGADTVEMWVYGNRWDWVNPPDTPPVRLRLHLRDRDERETPVEVDRVRWQEWWLCHRRLPVDLRHPVRLEGVEISDGWQSQKPEIFLDSIRFFREELLPLRFENRPRRNLTLFEGQSPGSNIGPGNLPFPTREQTILPMHLVSVQKLIPI